MDYVGNFLNDMINPGRTARRRAAYKAALGQFNQIASLTKRRRPACSASGRKAAMPVRSAETESGERHSDAGAEGTESLTGGSAGDEDEQSGDSSSASASNQEPAGR